MPDRPPPLTRLTELQAQTLLQFLQRNANFQASDALRGFTEFPKFVHPWDRSADQNPSALPLVRSDWLSCVIAHAENGALAAMAEGVLQHFARRAQAGDASAARYLLRIACVSTESIQESSGQYRAEIREAASYLSRIPCMVGPLNEDKKDVDVFVRDVGVAARHPARRQPRRDAQRKKTPAIRGIPINRLAERVIEYLDRVRIIVVHRGNLDNELAKIGLGRELFERIKQLPRLENVPEVVAAWWKCGSDVIRSRYGNLSSIQEILPLGRTRVRRGRPGAVEAELATALKQAIATLAPDPPAAAGETADSR